MLNVFWTFVNLTSEITCAIKKALKDAIIKHGNHLVCFGR